MSGNDVTWLTQARPRVVKTLRVKKPEIPREVIYQPLQKERARPAARKPREVKERRLTVSYIHFDKEEAAR